jgi:hypothetical protein
VEPPFWAIWAKNTADGLAAHNCVFCKEMSYPRPATGLATSPPWWKGGGK